MLTQQIKEYALHLGYTKVGITAADDFTEYFDELQRRGASYDFFQPDVATRQKNTSPKTKYPWAKSIIVLAYDYGSRHFPEELLGKIGRIYQARCYNPPPHFLHGARVRLLQEFLKEKGIRVEQDKQLPARGAAARAGVASIGRNTFAYVDGAGSFVVLDLFVVDAELEVDAPRLDCECPPGCQACVRACPTKALEKPYHLEPRRCIAFNAWMTRNELGHGITDSIPADIRPHMEQRVHGCDLCQEACPRNRIQLQTPMPRDPYLETAARDFSLVQMLHMPDGYYEQRIHPLMYNYIREPRLFQRNAAVALGNTHDEAYVPHLIQELQHPDEAVRGHVAWALGEIGGESATQALLQHLPGEASDTVRAEIEAALGRVQAPALP